MASPNGQRDIATFSRNPNSAGITGLNGQFGINVVDGTWWKYDAVTLKAWVQTAGPGNLGTYAPVAMCESLNLAVGASAVHVSIPTQAMKAKSLAVALNGTTINSAANVVVTIAIVGGATIGTVELPTGTVAGEAVVTTLAAPVAIPAGSVISATVTTAATVAAGTGSVTLGLYTA